VFLLHPLTGEAAHPRVDGSGLRAAETQALRPPAFVDDLDDHRRVAGLLQSGGRRPTCDPHARFGIDVHGEQHPRIQPFLKRRGVAGLPGPQQFAAQISRHRRAEVLERLEESLDIGRQRLTFDCHCRQDAGFCATVRPLQRWLAARHGYPIQSADGDRECQSRNDAAVHAGHSRHCRACVKNNRALTSRVTVWRSGTMSNPT
jgi:hypothetical protein